MELVDREVGVVYTTSSFSLSRNTIVINVADHVVDIIPIKNKLHLTYNLKQKLIDKFKNKTETDSFEVMLLKNYSFLRIYLRELFTEIIEPLVLNHTLKDHDVILLTGLDLLDDQIINTIQIVLENHDYFYLTYKIKLNYKVLIKEKDLF